MLDLLAETVPLALAGAISPLALLGALVLLGGSRRPLLRCGLFAAGVVTMTAIFFVAVYVALRLDLGGTTGHHGLLSSSAAQLAMAVLLLLTAGFFLFKAPSPEAQQRVLARVDSPRIPTIAFFLVGMAMMWFSASFIVIVTIVHRMSVAGLPFHDNAVVLVIAILITALPALIPFGAAVVGGDVARARLQRLGRWTTVNGRYILGAMMLVLAAQNLLHAFGA
ncbi:MAG: GAP family protein [Gaiellales bacterium]